MAYKPQPKPKRPGIGTRPPPGPPVVVEKLDPKAHQFKPGQSGNPAGRPKGTVGGRAGALAILDAMLSRAENKHRLGVALERDFQKNPVQFFKQIIMPLVPREHLLRHAQDEGKAPVRVLFDAQAAAADPNYKQAAAEVAAEEASK